MSELNSYTHNFREFQHYWFDLQEKIDSYARPIPGRKLDSDNYEPHELMAHSMTALGDPGQAIYGDIHEHGENEVENFLVEDAEGKDEAEEADVYWQQFQEADQALRNPRGRDIHKAGRRRYGGRTRRPSQRRLRGARGTSARRLHVRRGPINMSQDYIDSDYLLNGEPEDGELLEAVESLADTAYRNVTEWKDAVRSEDPVERIEKLGEEAAQTAYLLDRVQSEWANRNRDRIGYDRKARDIDLPEHEKKIVQAGLDVYRFTNDAGTQMEFLGKENRIGDSLDEMNYGDFCLISGDRLETVDREYGGGIETINDKLRMMNPGVEFDVEIEQDPDLDRLEEESDVVEFDLI